MRAMLVCLLIAPAAAAEDIAEVPARLQRAGKDENKKYYLIGDKKNAPAPKEGFGLVVILPGGDGSAEFLPFVKRLYKFALPPGYLAAQPVAVKWNDAQEIVWPTANDKNDVSGMKFTTEAFVEEVIDDVTAKYAVDKSRVFTLSWSSGGPAAYPISLTSKKVTGSFVAMSVFRPDWFPPLAGAKGHAYYLYHSPDDRVCPFRMAEDAKTKLAENGGVVHLKEYAGGHGWTGDWAKDVKDGITWLEANRAAAKK
jgi:predicted esterase